MLQMSFDFFLSNKCRIVSNQNLNFGQCMFSPPTSMTPFPTSVIVFLSLREIKQTGYPFLFMKREEYSNSHKAICLRAAPELVFSKLKIQLPTLFNLQNESMLLCKLLAVTQMNHSDPIMPQEALYCVYYAHIF